MTKVLTNIGTYLAIAEDALAESVRLDAAARSPKPNGEPGNVIVLDPEQRSFKQSLVAIAFSGMYLEALLGHVGVHRLGKPLYSKIERQTTYEEKLALLGLTDSVVLATCKRFREARNDLVHEKVIELSSLKVSDLRFAQEEAKAGVEFVKTVSAKLSAAP